MKKHLIVDLNKMVEIHFREENVIKNRVPIIRVPRGEIKNIERIRKGRNHHINFNIIDDTKNNSNEN